MRNPTHSALHGCTFCAQSLDRATVHKCLQLHGLHGGSIDTVQPCRAVRPENGSICKKSLSPAPPGKSGSAPDANAALDSAQTPAREKSALRLKQELRPASTFIVHARTAGKRSRSTGASHWNCRYADDIVEFVVDRVHAGVPVKAVARDLGIARRTIRDWIQGRRRAPPMRLVVTRRPLDYQVPALIGLADLPIPPTVDGPSGAVDKQGIERGQHPPEGIA